MNSKLNLLQNIGKNGIVYHEPFPYIIIYDALSPSVYEELVKNYPSNEIIAGDIVLKNNTRYQLNIKNTWGNSDIAPIWQDFAKYHTSQTFYRDVISEFGSELDIYYQHLGDLFKRETIWRSKEVKVFSRDFMSLDCQIGINSPVTEESAVIGPHMDNPVELYAGLFYLRDPNDNSEGGTLQIYRQKNSSIRYRPKTPIPLNELEVINEVPYEPNVFVIFLCTPHSIHGVTPRSVTPFSRRLVNIIAESSENFPCVK